MGNTVVSTEEEFVWLCILCEIYNQKREEVNASSKDAPEEVKPCGGCGEYVSTRPCKVL